VQNRGRLRARDPALDNGILLLMDEPSWSLRAARPEDYDFLFALHKATMREYVERVWGWDDEEQARILRTRLQPDGWHVIQSQNQDIGLLVVDEEDGSIRLAEIELMPAWQGRGIGSSIVRWLMKEAAAAGKPLTLRVLHVNERARDLYERLGFRPFKEIETHVYLRWDSASGTYPP
jgi:ribosomal protein S18 acetylase RimI-like enzyme